MFDKYNKYDTTSWMIFLNWDPLQLVLANILLMLFKSMAESSITFVLTFFKDNSCGAEVKRVCCGSGEISAT